MSDTIDSGTTAFLNVAFEDQEGNPAAPTSVFASLRCVSPPRPIRPEAELESPASSMDIMITNGENTMISRAPEETRRLTVRAVYGTDDEFVTHFDYQLRKAT